MNKKTGSQWLWVIILVFGASMLILAGCRSSGQSTTSAKADTGTITGKITTPDAAKTTLRTTTNQATQADRSSLDNGVAQPSPTGQVTGAPEPTDPVDNPDNPVDFSMATDGPFVGLKYDPSNFDLGGRTVTFGMANIKPREDGDPLQSEAERITWARYRAAEKKFNFKLDWIEHKNVPNSQIQVIIANYSAGLKYAEVMNTIATRIYPQYIRMGFAIPLDEYINFENPTWKKIDWLTKHVDNKHYVVHPGTRPVAWGTVYHPQILEREGCEDIMAVYQKGEWNWEKFLDYALKTTRDINGDGIIDIYGTAQTNLINGLQLSNDCKIIAFNQGIPRLQMLEPRFYHVYNFFRDLTFIYKVAAPVYNVSTVAMVFSGNPAPYIVNQKATWLRTAPTPEGPDAIAGVEMGNQLNCWSLYPISDFTPQEVIALFVYTLWNNPNDLDSYITNPREVGISAYINTYSTYAEAEFWYDYHVNAMFDYDYFRGVDGLVAAVNSINSQVAAGSFYGSAIEEIKSSMEGMIRTSYGN